MISLFASIVSLALFSIATLFADPPEDPTTSAERPARRIYVTRRLMGQRPVVDGKLDDACWQAGEWAGDFVQWIPKEGAKPSQPTFIKLLYDDYAI